MPSSLVNRLAALFTLALALSLPACVGYNVYPPEPGERGFTNPNNDPFPSVMKAAIQWTALRYPPNASTEFTFKSQGNQTAVTWTMSGHKNFMSKAFGLLMGIDRMVGGDFEKGLAQLKSVAESASKQK